MEDKEKYSIDLLTALAERTIKRLWVLIILLVVLLFGTNAAWVIYESQFEVVEETNQTVEQDIQSDGGNTIVSGIGDVTYGENSADG